MHASPYHLHISFVALIIVMVNDSKFQVHSFLIPSQVKHCSLHNNHSLNHFRVENDDDDRLDTYNQLQYSLTPSQTIHSSKHRRTILHQNLNSSSDSVDGDNNIDEKVINDERQTTKDNDGDNNIGSTGHPPYNTQTSLTKKKHKFKNYGNLPDTQWRAIPMNHLRSHPRFEPLQHPDEIKRINQLEDVKYFRQDSWQWDALHSGRCTTSQATPALGFLENNAAKLLGVPRSLQKGCTQAFYRLSSPAIRTLEEMNRILCTGGNGGDKKIQNVWKVMQDHNGSEDSHSHHYPFLAKYMPTITKEDLESRRDQAKTFISNMSTPMRVRMNWGNQQEATAILTALNYFAKEDDGLKVREVGMCGSGLEFNTKDKNEEIGNLIIGASPDAVIEYSNGTLEALEVKNHCPFVPTEWTNGSKKRNAPKGDKFKIRELPLQSNVPPIYFPQLQMEMLCLGKNCQSAIMVRQTATCGSILLRVHRDDEWLDEMIYWLQRFVSDYVEKQIEPPPNFFWEGKEAERYQRFVQRTKDLSEQVDVVAEIENGKIQRVLGERGMKLPLFLD